MRGIITLTTDFGLRDPFVAVMKGQILRRAPDAVLVDVTHDVFAHQVAEAGFWLARIPAYFPEGTVHLAVVDPGVGTARALVAVACAGQWFLAPDNGLLSEVMARPGATARTIAASTFEAIGARADGATFHGRDLLAPLAAELATGRLPFAALGAPCRPRQSPPLPLAHAVADGFSGTVVTVDHFGNLVTSIEGSQLEPGCRWEAVVAGRVAERVAAYGDGPAGGLVALVNSWGLVEIAESGGSAAARLGVGRGEPVLLRRRRDG
ncbi:MAG TPA: SAM-dependent chlorinase/fluorinase [Steroidobacteraceae bacterium]|jgi:S-adenosylmethionine hydrolase